MRQFLQYLPVLLFTAITLAQSFFGTPTGVTHVNTSRSNSTTPRIGPQVAIFRYGDLMSGPEPVDRYANMNVSPVTGVGGSNGGPYTVDIRMGTNKQHVAEFAGQRMYDLIHDALMKICPYERGRIGCYESMPGAGEPNDDLTMTYEYASEYWILDVPYYTDKGDYATNAYITITARAIFRNWKYPGLGAATYGLAAGIYARATENMENCYMESFNDETRVYQFCNVPDRVMIALPAEDGSVTESWLSMTIEFDGPTKYGQFDCEGTKKSVDGFWEAAVRPDMAKALGHPENEWNTCISCTDDENAFDVEKWREHCVCLGGKCQTRG